MAVRFASGAVSMSKFSIAERIVLAASVSAPACSLPTNRLASFESEPTKSVALRLPRLNRAFSLTRLPVFSPAVDLLGERENEFAIDRAAWAPWAA